MNSFITERTTYRELDYSRFLIEENGGIIEFRLPGKGELTLIYDIVGYFLFKKKGIRDLSGKEYEQFSLTSKFNDELLEYILTKDTGTLSPVKEDLKKIKARFYYLQEHFNNTPLPIDFYDVFVDLASKMIELSEKIKVIRF